MSTRRLSPLTAALATLAAGLPLLAAGQARADFIFDLTAPNSAITGTGPYVQVDVALLNSTTATVTFDALTNGGNTYYLMAHGSADVNVNGPFSLSSATGTKGGSVQATYSDGGSGNVSSFGTFNQTVDSSDGWNSRSQQIVLTLAATGANSWSDAASVLTANTSGYLAAAHVGYDGGDVTGYVGGNGTATVPEPGAAALLGIGLLGLGWTVRRRQA